MNRVWSACIQGVGTLYQSRCLRFSDLFRDTYMSAFRIPDGGKILEIGCGPGALAQALHRWYPAAEITGVDRDSGFIEFARENISGVAFVEGDASALAYADNTFDVTISNTVAEHVEPSAFWGEQYRVLKPGGVCLMLSARRGITHLAPCLAEQSETEKEVWARVEQRAAEMDKRFGVCAYPMSEAEYPSVMEKYGFRHVCTDYITVNLTPDDPRYSSETAHAMVEAQRRCALDALTYLPGIASVLVTEAELAIMRAEINARYDRRIMLYDAGERQWDVSMSLTMILRGVK